MKSPGGCCIHTANLAVFVSGKDYSLAVLLVKNSALCDGRIALSLSGNARLEAEKVRGQE
jgi:nitrogen fixation protein